MCCCIVFAASLSELNRRDENEMCVNIHILSLRISMQYIHLDDDDNISIKAIRSLFFYFFSRLCFYSLNQQCMHGCDVKKKAECEKKNRRNVNSKEIAHFYLVAIYNAIYTIQRLIHKVYFRCERPISFEPEESANLSNLKYLAPVFFVILLLFLFFFVHSLSTSLLSMKREGGKY